MRVLILEPDKQLAQIISKYLKGIGLKVDVANSAEQAISLADNHRPDLVCLELIMDGHNGLEFIYEFKSYQDWLDVPIVIYSEFSSEELAVNPKLLRLMDVKDHLYKPTSSLEELSKTILKYLGEPAINKR